MNASRAQEEEGEKLQRWNPAQLLPLPVEGSWPARQVLRIHRGAGQHAQMAKGRATAGWTLQVSHLISTVVL